MEEYEEVLKFWLEDTPAKMMYISNPEFDESIRIKFGRLHERAVNGELESWEGSKDSCLALIILLDQFSRNLCRGDPRSFSSDPYALEIARRGIGKGFDLEVGMGRDLFYMPFMHSENIEDQKKSCELFEKYGLEIGENRMKYALGHKKIIEKFGRFPNRNEVLGRESTPEEVDFLEKGGGY